MEKVLRLAAEYIETKLSGHGAESVVACVFLDAERPAWTEACLEMSDGSLVHVTCSGDGGDMTVDIDGQRTEETDALLLGMEDTAPCIAACLASVTKKIK